MRLLLLVWTLMLTTLAQAGDAVSQHSLLTPLDVAVIVNINDPNSVEMGEYYLKVRQIPPENLIRVDLPVGTPTIYKDQFSKLQAQINEKVGADIKVLALMWTTPYAVHCYSITSALTLGLDLNFCKKTCDPATKNPYFNSLSLNPKRDHDMRLAMLIPTDSVEITKALIDRGMLTGFSLPQSTGYFVRTGSKARSLPRERFYPKDFFKVDSKKIVFRNLKQEFIEHKKDVMFYFIGATAVPKLDTLNFIPGAVADHLTSYGGSLTASRQMPATKWIEAGATGSYGTVSEPCNYWQKFSNPEVLIKYYLAGNTLVEAYWKSVYWPAQGLFIGEPLAAPFKNIP